ncbi:MAG: hydrolase [Emergencia sp.]
MGDRDIPRISGTLRAKSIQIPEVIWQAKGIVVMGRRMKSVLFSTDIAIIRNCNADAVLAVYPFTPQQIISQTIISASSIPVLVGVGGGTTKGARSALMAKDAEAQGAFGVVVNSPMSNENITLIRKFIDIPVVATVVSEKDDIDARLRAGVSILNVSAAAKTPELVRHIRADFPKVPIIATGGPTDDTILETIQAGANTISYTPPSTADIFEGMMKNYRKASEEIKSPTETDPSLLNMLELL